MSDTQQQGRARGRARGRSRGQPQADAPRRPGEESHGVQQQQRPPAAVVPPPQVPPSQQAAAATGRAAHRGGARGQKMPGDEGLAGAMSAVTLGGAGDNGNGNGRPTSGRGSLRGSRDAEYEPRTRPAHIQQKTGSAANSRPVNLCANYFKVKSTPNSAIYQYHVNFKPDIESLGMRKALLGNHRPSFNQSYLFDGMALWSTTKLQLELTEFTSQRRTDNAIITMEVKFIKELHPDDPIVLQICNIQMRRNFTHMKFSLLGRNYYDMNQAALIPQHKLELWPGFVTSIRQHENSVLMCVDLSFKILRQDTVFNQMSDLYNRHGDSFRDMCEKKLLGSIVLTRYNNRTYRIDDFKWDLNPKNTFPKKDGSQISYMEYYQSQYNIRIQNDDQPLIVSLPKKSDIKRGMTQPIILVPELCTMTGLDEDTRTNFTTMKDVAAHTRVDPDKRVESLLGFLRRIKACPEIVQEMRNWDMSYEDKLVEFPARVIMAEKIGQACPLYQPQQPADWSREMRDKKLLSTVGLANWIVFSTQRDRNLAQDFIDTLARVARGMGIEVNRPATVALPDDRTNTFVRSLTTELSPEVQMAVVIVPNNRKDRYDAIKKLCCVDRPVASQVIVGRTLSKKPMLMSVCTKIAIQMNCKLGGEAWYVPIPLKKVMVVGFDTYHDSSQKGMSAGGLVASLNDTLTKYHSRVVFQKPGVEMFDAIVPHFTACLRRYHEVNQALPDRIIFYRDGVGDGQIAKVKDWELEQIRKCFKQIGPDFDPKFAFVIVNKRLNTRFFRPQNGRHFANPEPGTVIDQEVTRPERYDFFLVSQSVRQGTVAPTQYNIIADTSGLQPDHMQRLAYKLTHLYYNWPGTIRVPAPCQYAHKLAFLAGQSLHREPSNDLSDTLYYL